VILVLVWACLIGLVVGALAKLILPGKDPSPWWVTMLLGIGGAVVANLLGKMVGLYKEGQGAGFIASLLGAVLLVWIYRMVAARKGGASAA
jgi:uncharacterized membrane protein YeaQ/YmgE (transglycosylase-associated protein family)